MSALPSAVEETKMLALILKGVVPIITFIFGFLVSRFTMSKKERKDHEHQLLETTRGLIDEKVKAFEAYSAAIYQYTNAKKPTGDNFFDISTKSVLYFNRITLICDAVIAKQIEQNTLRNTIIPNVKDAVERTIPDTAKTLRTIAVNQGFKYNSDFKREDYKSIYSVYEKYVVKTENAR